MNSQKIMGLVDDVIHTCCGVAEGRNSYDDLHAARAAVEAAVALSTPASCMKLNLSDEELKQIAAAPGHIVLEPERNDPRLAELVGVLRLFLEQTEEPPDPNCSCFIAPPCSDCIQHAGLREIFALARTALEKVPEL